MVLIPDSPLHSKPRAIRKLKLLDYSDEKEKVMRTLEDSDTRTRTPLAQKKEMNSQKTLSTNKKIIKSNKSYTKTFT